MSHYRHDPAPSHRAEQFIAYCAEHITEWPRGQFAATSGKFKKFHFAERVSSLSPACWTTCSRKQWLQAKATLAAKPLRPTLAPAPRDAHGAVSVQKAVPMLALLCHWILAAFRRGDEHRLQNPFAKKI